MVATVSARSLSLSLSLSSLFFLSLSFALLSLSLSLFPASRLLCCCSLSSLSFSLSLFLSFSLSLSLYIYIYIYRQRQGFFWRHGRAKGVRTGTARETDEARAGSIGDCVVTGVERESERTGDGDGTSGLGAQELTGHGSHNGDAGEGGGPGGGALEKFHCEQCRRQGDEWACFEAGCKVGESGPWNALEHKRLSALVRYYHIKWPGMELKEKEAMWAQDMCLSLEIFKARHNEFSQRDKGKSRQRALGGESKKGAGGREEGSERGNEGRVEGAREGGTEGAWEGGTEGARVGAIIPVRGGGTGGGGTGGGDEGMKWGGDGGAKWAAIEEEKDPEKNKRKGGVTDDDAAPRKTPKP